MTCCFFWFFCQNFLLVSTIIISFTEHVKSSIFEGGVFVDATFTSVGRNGNSQLDDKTKQNIKDVLNDEFCSLDIKSQAQENTCTIQNLKFRVKKKY